VIAIARRTIGAPQDDGVAIPCQQAKLQGNFSIPPRILPFSQMIDKKIQELRCHSLHRREQGIYFA